MTGAADVGAVRAVITWGAPCVYAICCMQAADRYACLSHSRLHPPHVITVRIIV